MGFVQYKKIRKKNVKRGCPAIFGYQMEINSQSVSCNSVRGEKKLFNSPFVYVLDIKRDDGNTDHVEINAGEFPRLVVWSEKYGLIDFCVNYEGMFLNYKSKTENFNVEELIVFKSNAERVSNSSKEYTYQIRYCDKDTEISDNKTKGLAIREITGSSTPNQQENNKLSILEMAWKDDILCEKRVSEVEGTVEEMVLKHQMGIDSFSHFRYHMMQILPIKQDIISAILSDEIIEEFGLSLFMDGKYSSGKNIAQELKKHDN